MNKTVYSASEAAKLAGVSITAMTKRINKGTISATRQPDGKKQYFIDASELVRVYPHIRFEAQQNDDSLPPVDNVKIAVLEAQLEAYKRENDLLRDFADTLNAKLDREAEERRRLTMILTDQRKVETQPEPEHKPLHVWVPQEKQQPEKPKKKWWKF